MKTRNLILAALAVILAFGVPTLISPAQAQIAQEGYLRITHASPGAPAVDIYLDGGETPAVRGLEFGKSTDFIALPVGSYTVAIRPAGGGAADTVLQSSIRVLRGVAAEAVALGLVGRSGRQALRLGYYQLNLQETDGRARLYVIHASPDAPAVDVRSGDAVVVRNLAFSQGTLRPVELDPGLYSLQVVPTGATEPVVVALDDIELKADTIYTVMAIGSLDEIQPLVLMALTPKAPPPPVGQTGFVRVVHASPGAPNVDVYVDGSRAVADLAFGAATEFLELPAREYTVAIRPAGSPAASAPVFEAVLDVTKGLSAEVVALGLPEGEPAFNLAVFPVDRTATVGLARIYLVHAAPQAGAVDVRVNGKVVVSDLVFGEYTARALNVDPGIYNIAATPAGRQTPVVTYVYQTELKADTIYTALAVGDPIQANPLVLTSDPLSDAVAGKTGAVRVVHASPGAPNVDVYVDGAPAITGLAFGAASEFVELPAKEYTVAIRPAGSPAINPPVYETVLPVPAGISAEVMAGGVLGGDPAFGLSVYAVDRSGLAGKARLYVIHAAPGAGAVDIRVNGRVVAPTFEYGDYTATPLEVDPGLYNIALTPAGRTSPVIAYLYQTELAAGTVYTVLAIGDPIRDNPLLLTAQAD